MTISHSLETFPSGGLLLDHESGDLFTLNTSATFIWTMWLAGTAVESIAATLAATHGLSLNGAEQDVATALRVVPSYAQARPDPGEFVYERSMDGYVFSRNGRAVLAIDEKEVSIGLPPSSRATSAEIAAALLAISPKLMALAGDFILHASGVILDGAITALCGDSGAGKTTTARALVRAGASLFCEDKLLVKQRSGKVEGLVGVEQQIQLWADDATQRLASGGSAPILRLDHLPDGEWIPLREIGFIAALRREGKFVSARTLLAPDAGSLIFRNAFCGSDLRVDWQRQLENASTLARSVPTFELTMPEGIAALDGAAADFVDRKSIRAASPSQIATTAS